MDNSYFISRLYCVCCPDLVTNTAQKRRRHPLLMRDKIWISGQFLLYFSSLLCLLSWSCHNHCSKDGRHPLMIRDKIWISGQFLLYFSSLLCLLSWSCHNHCSKETQTPSNWWEIRYESVDNSYFIAVDNSSLLCLLSWSCRNHCSKETQTPSND